MKKSLVGGLLLSVASFAAQAADLPAHMPVKAMPVVQSFSWTGLYIGAHVGYGWGDAKFTDPFFPGWSLTNDFNGVLGGGQIGYNQQFGQWVFGVEADISGASLDGQATDVAPFAGDLYRTNVDLISTVTGRVGFAFERSLLYVKGGGAWAHTKYEYTPLSFGDNTLTSATETRAGWTIGGGLEYAFDPKWSARVEYNYMDFGTKDAVDLAPLTSGFTAGIDQQIHAIKFGVNFRPF